MIRSSSTTPRTPRRAVQLAPAAALVAVLAAAVNLRPSISAVGPVIESIRDFVGAGGAFSGALTAFPGVFFALFGLGAVAIARKVGLTGALVLGMIASFAGQLLRPWIAHPGAFLALSALAVAGIALGNVLLPAWIKTHGGSATVRLMTIYTCVLALGGTVGPMSALVTGADSGAAPVTGSLTAPAPWQIALVVWAAVACLQLVPWAPLWRRVGHDYPPEPPSQGRPVPVWKSGTAVALMFFFGLQSMNAYIQMGWLPSMLKDAGVASAPATWSMIISNSMGAVGGVLMPSVIARTRKLWRLTALFAGLTAAGWLMVIALMSSGAHAFPAVFPLAAGLVLGIGGFCFPTAIALIPARTHAPAVTARLSGFVQPVGYFLAAAGPFLVGTGQDLLGSWVPILWVLVVLALVMGVAGFRAARNHSVDSELGLA